MRILLIALYAVLTAATLSAQNFRVQVAAFNDTVPSSYFRERGVQGITMSVDEMGMYHYYAGSFRTREEAEVVRQAVEVRGFPGAAIIDLEEQRILANENCPDARSLELLGIAPDQPGNYRTIYFESGSSQLLPDARTELDRHVQTMREDPALTLNVMGYTDGQGTPQANIDLATARARAARNYLIAKGVAADRMFLKIFGEAKPARRNQDEQGRDLPHLRKFNRRVVLVTLAK